MAKTLITEYDHKDDSIHVYHIVRQYDDGRIQMMNDSLGEVLVIKGMEHAMKYISTLNANAVGCSYMIRRAQQKKKQKKK